MSKTKGFSLIELLIVMSVVAILVAIIIPSFRGIQQEGWITKAEKEVHTLQLAIESYYRHKNAYPTALSDLLTAQPQIINTMPKDPWKTDGDNYGYEKGTMAGFGEYYVVYSKSINGNKDWQVNTGTPSLASSGDDVVLSNLPVVKQ
jgi:general secretion pathway protein G